MTQNKMISFFRYVWPDTPNQGACCRVAASAGRSKSPAQHLWTCFEERPLIWSPHLFRHWHRCSVSELLDTMNLSLPSVGLLSAGILRFSPLWCLWRFSTTDSMGAPPGFRRRLHFSRLICIRWAGSHWRDQGNLCVADAGQLPGRDCRFH